MENQVKGSCLGSTISIGNVCMTSNQLFMHKSKQNWSPTNPLSAASLQVSAAGRNLQRLTWALMCTDTTDCSNWNKYRTWSILASVEKIMPFLAPCTWFLKQEDMVKDREEAWPRLFCIPVLRSSILFSIYDDQSTSIHQPIELDNED